MSTELTKKSPSEIVLVQQAASETAIESFSEKYHWFEGTDPALLLAQADRALEKPKAERTQREAALVHLSDTMVTVSNAAEKGLVTSARDAELLTDALIYGAVRPSTAVKYLRPHGASHLERALSPRELAVAISIHQDVSYMDEKVSIATIARAADATGISLKREIDEVDMDMLLSNMHSYEGSVDLHIVEDDPDDGPVGGRKKIGVAGVTLATRSEAGVNAIFDEDKLTGPQRVEEFALMASIEDEGEKEDLYRHVDEK